MNLLFIAPLFFGYEKSIKQLLLTRYENVIFKCEIPFNSPNKYYMLRRLSKNLAEKVLMKYNQKLVELVKRKNIERVFIIRGYGLNELFLEQIKKFNPNLKIYHYQWDSAYNNPNALTISRYADYNFSFDLRDTHLYPQFKHLPLFYIWDSLPENLISSPIKQDIDILFVGGYHSARHTVIKKVQSYCDQAGLTLKSHIYLYPGSYLRDRLSTKTIHYEDVKFRKISRQEYCRLLCRSRVVLDIQSSTQSGATIRTFEALSLGRKLLSTNSMLKNELFYSPRNIQLWNPEESLDVTTLLNTEFDHSKDNYIRNLNEWLQAIGI